MGSADHRRRTRRIALLLSALLIPTAAVILLGLRVLRQESELAERRASEQQRQALDQLRRELTARLQALRLGEVNRRIGEPAGRLPSDSPIVFVAPLVQDRLQPPWVGGVDQPPRTPAFVRLQSDGEDREFRQHDPVAAAVAYHRAEQVASTLWERCSARLSLGRSYVKAGLAADAARIDRAALRECGDVMDADGVPFGLYAAQRLLAIAGSDTQDAAAITDYLVQRVHAPAWRSPNEALLLQALLRTIGSPATTEPLEAIAGEIRKGEQIAALAQDTHEHLAKLQQAARSAPGDLAWIGYGEEPWLLTLVSPASFAAPVVMAVSSRGILPGDVTLRVTPAEGSMPLGDGFVDLYVEWPRGRFAAPQVPGMLYGSMLLTVLGAALLAGYLLLRDVHREAETAALRSHFVASVSHELKTPLTSIRAHAETMLLGRTGTAQAATDYLKTIVSETERLTRLVDSVLDFSRIDQGQKTYDLQETPLEQVVQSAARAMEHPLAQLGFTLAIATDGTAPVVRADPDALTQAILNLLGNAIKYSGDARTIEMRIGTRHDEAFVDVVDHGIGIGRDDQARIFDRFHRVQSVETTGIAGTGLGLTLARHVVEAHRGRIAVESHPGRGSTFSVRIPLQAQA